MPLGLLLPLVVIGIAGIGVLLHLSGLSRRFDITDAETARREWLRHRPGDIVRRVHLAGGAALVETARGPGLLRPFGADTVAFDVVEMTERGDSLRIGFGAFAAPPLRLTLDAGTRRRWLQIWRGADA